MSAISDQLRAQAGEQRAAATTILGATDFNVVASKQVAAVTGLVSANLYESLAMMLDAIQGTANTDMVTERRRAILNRNDAIRRAAAKGDWNEFDKLVSSGRAGGVSAETVAGTGEGNP